MHQTWDKQFNELGEWMTRHKTVPERTTVILTQLKDCVSHPHDDMPRVHPDVQRVMELQDSAGWELPLTGVWFKDWESLQETYYRHIRSQKLGRQ